MGKRGRMEPREKQTMESFYGVCEHSLAYT